jgi:hypothetical protein
MMGSQRTSLIGYEAFFLLAAVVLHPDIVMALSQPWILWFES